MNLDWKHDFRIMFVLGTDHLTRKGGGYSLWFRSEFFFGQLTRIRIFIFLSRKARIFFPESNIRLYDKNSASDYFFSSIKISNIGNQNIFLEKKHNPPSPSS